MNKRKAYDRWGVEITCFNRGTAFYVDCDCGNLAKLVYQKHYFQCSTCQQKYMQTYGEYVTEAEYEEIQRWYTSKREELRR